MYLSFWGKIKAFGLIGSRALGRALCIDSCSFFFFLVPQTSGRKKKQKDVFFVRSLVKEKLLWGLLVLSNQVSLEMELTNFVNLHYIQWRERNSFITLRVFNLLCVCVCVLGTSLPGQKEEPWWVSRTFPIWLQWLSSTVGAAPLDLCCSPVTTATASPCASLRNIARNAPVGAKVELRHAANSSRYFWTGGKPAKCYIHHTQGGGAFKMALRLISSSHLLCCNYTTINKL